MKCETKKFFRNYINNFYLMIYHKISNFYHE